MSKQILRWLVIVAVVSAPGCASSGVPVMDPPEKEPSAPAEKKGEVSLAELLTRPRAELAELADEWAGKVRVQEQAYRNGQMPYTLLPDLRLPLVVPVLREAHFSAEAGFSLPPYVAEGTRDNALALHLAKYGDVEAARKLAEPEDGDVLKRIDALCCERNYPVEWARLVGLMLHAAQVRLATGEEAGFSDLEAYHHQLRELLGPKAAQGALGASLLASGHHALTLAKTAWQEQKRTKLAEQVETALAEWGKVPAPALAIAPGMARSDVARILRSPGKGHAIAALSTLRALDLLDLPIPADGAPTVLALFDTTDRLAEILVTYRARLGESYPEPRQLAQALEDYSLPAEDAPKAPGLRCRTYQLNNLSCEVAVVPEEHAVGAFVRLRESKPPSVAPVLARDFGAVHLDRSFEQNRLRFTLDNIGETLRTDRARTLAQIANPLPALQPAEAILEREGKQDLVSRLILRYSWEESAPPLSKIALPLWTLWGPGRIEGVEDEHGGHLALVWQDAQTRYTVRLPYSSRQPAEFEAQDRRGPQDQAQRTASASVFDRGERQARLAAGKPLTRLPRHADVAWALPSLHEFQLALGMTRDQVAKAIPTGQPIVKQELAGGLWAVFTAEPPHRLASVARQLFVRFDKNERVVELRIRYGEGPSENRGAGWNKELLKVLKKQGGAPWVLAAPWVGLWSDLPERKPAPALYRWQDDLTVVLFQTDAGCTELTLRDCSAEHAAGVPLPPLEYLPRGPEACKLGDARSELLERWNVSQPVTTADGALVLTPKKADVFDALLVWFDKDRAVRIVARQVRGEPAKPTFAQVGQKVSLAWAKDLRTLGWPTRQDFLSPDVLQGLGWNDDVTRVRIFWQEAASGPPRLYTEWKEWKGD